MKNDQNEWIGWGLNDRGQTAFLIKSFLRRKFSYGKTLTVDGPDFDLYDQATADAVALYQQKKPVPTPYSPGIANKATLVAMGLAAPDRHAMLCFRGTGGILGLDYTDRLADACASRWEKIDVAPELMPSMGAVPVGAAADINALSGLESARYMADWAVSWVMSNPKRSYGSASYSLGSIAETLFFIEHLPGGRLYNLGKRIGVDYFAQVTFGNPCRSFGWTFYLGKVVSGEGISDIRIPDDARQQIGWARCELVQEGDRYGNVPQGLVGKVMRDVYNLIMIQQIHDFTAVAMTLLKGILKLLDDAGIELPLNIFGLATSVIIGFIQALIPGFKLDAPNDETAAAVQAAVIFGKFAIDSPPTRAHITYEFEQCGVGLMTYFDLGVQHMMEWGLKTPVKL